MLDLEGLLRHWETMTERLPVVRTGERDQIPHEVRRAVWYRDRGKCELCGKEYVPGVGMGYHGHSDGEPWELDHIVPWSAGGTDQSDNLRVLCHTCNRSRGNRHTYAHDRLPVTWWCRECASGPDLQCVGHWRRWCRLHRLAERVPEWNTTWQVTDDRPLVHAYCAHCDAPGLTDRTL